MGFNANDSKKEVFKEFQKYTGITNVKIVAINPNLHELINLGFKVVAHSVKELMPMWQRINYLLGLSKPSQYFNSGFIVPPLVKVTIGDMYKNQPIVINSLGLRIPDDASWETLGET